MLTQLILPMSTIPAVLNLAAKGLGAHLVHLGMATEIRLAGEGAGAGGAGGTRWSSLRHAESRTSVAVDGVECAWEFIDNRCPLGVETMVSRKVSLVAITVGGGSGGRYHCGECGLPIREVSTDVLVHWSLSRRWSPGVRVRHSWESDGIVVSGAGSEGTLGRP